ncbi:ribonuclease E activity regulator RraA [Sorangium sp. So ce1182]|uniref:ribonuclease E activity regulator RraA n=1 Tax=Sorangium sp. So ce1182 TaxID=3133334 RepID=UPI003F615477
MSSEIKVRTTDLCDKHPDAIAVADPIFRDYGGARLFHGRVATVKVHEANVLVRKALEEPGEGRVLVVDGGGSLRCALLGDNLADMAHRNGWAGLLVYGCIRDAEELARIPIGVKALATHPRKSGKKDVGDRDVPVTFAGITYVPGGFIYADVDGVLFARDQLT